MANWKLYHNPGLRPDEKEPLTELKMYRTKNIFGKIKNRLGFFQVL